jgi:hypothetical protein
MVNKPLIFMVNAELTGIAARQEGIARQGI